MRGASGCDNVPGKYVSALFHVEICFLELKLSGMWKCGKGVPTSVSPNLIYNTSPPPAVSPCASAIATSTGVGRRSVAPPTYGGGAPPSSLVPPNTATLEASGPPCCCPTVSDKSPSPRVGAGFHYIAAW